MFSGAVGGHCFVFGISYGSHFVFVCFCKSVTDLHICKNSVGSNSSSSRNCNCGPEYVCVDVCPEGGYSLSTLISWQHFPRSTSYRSECDISEDNTLSSSGQSKSATVESEEKEATKVASSTEYPITKSISQLNALHYLQIRHVFELLNFLISHLVCNEPEDPVEFLVNLLDKCLNYRESFGEPPQLFTPAHLKSVYTAFDPFERGHLTLSQYNEAMKSLGLANSITPYNQDPPLNDDECVEESTFVFEAERCLMENLKAMLRIPKLWEENRLLWKKKMAQKNLRQARNDLDDKTKEIIEEATEEGSRCTMLDFWKCPREQESRSEPEQLFLN